MSNFLFKEEKKISDQFKKKGFVIKKISDLKSLLKIRKIFVKSIKKNLKSNYKFKNENDLFNFIHKSIEVKKLNSFRLKIINDINKSKNLRELYYKISKPLLETIIGNELSMQLRVNLSIQMPKDDSSLLPIHSDVWSGDSPFESVMWLPLVDCYKTKSMYILPPPKYDKIKKIFLQKKSSSSKEIFQKIKKDLHWIKIKYGEVMIFNQCLPHGNVVNLEKSTRWSLNCRFKSVFSPYSDKKIGEFFEPITLKPVSELAISYELPKIS
jgi:sporadic carbohydrate cluster 2OG-Fe(II) oxygenase